MPPTDPKIAVNRC